MSDTKEMLERARDRFVPPDDVMESLIRKRDRKERNRRVSAAVLAIVLTLLSITGLMQAFRNTERPAIQPTPTPTPTRVDTGIFSGMGGWIAYGDSKGIWAMDPDRPGIRKQLSTHLGEPIAWSSDGSKLLIIRLSPRRWVDPPAGRRYQAQFQQALSVLDADETETILVDLVDGQFLHLSGGSFSPDGSEVVYANRPSDGGASSIYVVDTVGGTPRRLLAAGQRSFPSGCVGSSTSLTDPTFSPDGTQIAYIDGLGDWCNALLVMNADGSGPRVLLGDEVIPAHIHHLVWSPDGRRLAFDSARTQSSYVLGADGAGLTVVGLGLNPHWSPDGSRISYDDTAISYDDERIGNLVIEDADGTHVQRLGPSRFGPRSGPWIPLVQSEQAVTELPAANGEVPAASGGLTSYATLLLAVAMLALVAGSVLIGRRILHRS